jgi:thiol-disulfide isomerase/thioredoxin
MEAIGCVEMFCIVLFLKDVLVFYYTQWCGFCTALNHVLIQLARLFQGNGTMTIAR